MKHKLYSAVREDGKRTYCGPAAYMALTGRSYESARRCINRVRGCKDNTGITGLRMLHLQRALERAGKTVKKGRVFYRKLGFPTLKQWIDSRSKEERDSVCLVLTSTHFQVVYRNQFIDNHTKVPVKVDDAPGKRQRVQSVFYIS